jgi:hypothetical protein
MAKIPKPEDLVPQTMSLEKRLYANKLDHFSCGPDTGRTGNGKQRNVPPLALPMNSPFSKSKGAPGGKGGGNLVPRKPGHSQATSRRPYKRGGGPRLNGSQPLPSASNSNDIRTLGSQTARAHVVATNVKGSSLEDEKPTRKTLLQKADTFKSFIQSLEANVDVHDPGVARDFF